VIFTVLSKANTENDVSVLLILGSDPPLPSDAVIYFISPPKPRAAPAPKDISSPLFPCASPLIPSSVLLLIMNFSSFVTLAVNLLFLCSNSNKVI